MNHNKKAWLAVAVAVVAFSLRTPFSGVGSLIPLIQRDLNLSYKTAGTITTIPLVMFALTAPLAGALLQRINMRRMLQISLILIFAGVCIRSYFGIAGLFIGTMLTGVGVGFLNVTIPVLIRCEFPEKTGTMTSIYTLSMTIMSAIVSGSSIWLVQTLHVWNNALASVGVFPIIAIMLWTMVSRNAHDSKVKAENSHGEIPISKLFCTHNVRLALVMGLQAFLFYFMIAWLPSILIKNGIPSQLAAVFMSVLQLMGIVSNTIIPTAVQKAGNKGIFAIVAAIIYFAGLSGLLIQSPHMFITVISVVLLGLANGMSFCLALMFITLSGKNQEQSSKVSAFAQSFGYLLASPGAFVMGALFDLTNAWVFPIAIAMLISIFIAIVGKKAGDGLKTSV